MDERSEARRFAVILTDCKNDFTRARAILAAVRSPDAVALEQAIAAHLDQLTWASSGTRARYRQIADDHLLTAFGAAQPVASIARADVGRWLNELVDRGVSDKSIQNWHGLLAGVMKTAMRERWITASPCEGVRLPRRHEHRREEMVLLSPGDYRVLLAEVAEQHRPIVAFLAGTGMRWGEATALTVADVDRRHSPVMVSVTKAVTEDGQRHPVLGPPKTRRSRRTVSLSTDAGQAVSAHIAGRAGDALVFPSLSASTTWLDHTSFWKTAWRPAVRRATDRERHGDDALRRAPRIHDLRHTHASWLLAAGVDLMTVSRRLGHESIQTTVNVYGHLGDEKQERAAAALDRLLSV